jgi:acetyl-CoA carboxylase, biotin carboxylase subunit
MHSTKEAKIGQNKRRKALIDSINYLLKPVEKTYRLGQAAVKKTKEKFPLFCNHFENILNQHIIRPSKGIFRSTKMENVGNIITANVIKRLPHVDEAKIEEMLNSPSNKSFLETLTKGFGINPKDEKSYTVLGKGGFKRVLIANRGEIALRIIRACRELEIESVVIHSEEEKGTLAVKFADKKYNIGKSKNYLDIKKIVKAAKSTNCDAIHPGYGFLSENSKFAELCEKKKIKFIGPSSKMINRLGDKVEAKKAMMKSGVPIIQGMREDLKSKAQALKVSKEIGFPVIIKASAGGGGKGMRIVTKESEVEEGYDSAQKEAKNAFADSSLYMEKYIEDPRHIEFQIMADQHGNVIHLGERDCSIQRRHQKLIEEAPSPAMDKDLREKMGTAAVNAIKAIGYEGAGTVEFLLDKSNNFYFIEMNTRIQVEHGVTEIITNVDLVKEQIRLAEGAKLAYKQEDIKIESHSIECRINAEDPFNDFSPSPGTIINFLPPGGPGIRISSPCHSGYKITPQFDSLIALLICHGRSREEAISRMERALDEFIIEGVKTTIPFHKCILENRQFLRGNTTTSFIEHNKIMKMLKKEKEKKEEIKKETKILIVTTAIAKHLSKKQNSHASKVNSWTMAARHDAMNESMFEE